MTAVADLDRGAYVTWAKARGLAIVDDGDPIGGLAALISDLRKRPDTDGPHLAFLALAGGQHHSDPAAMRTFIEGFA